MSKIEIYPKVFVADKLQKIYIKTALDGVFTIKIQAMERYGIPHTAKYRIDEETRYSFLPVKKVGKDVYLIEYAFVGDQRYDVQIKNDDEIILKTHIYSIREEFVGLNVFKGETHVHSCRSDGAETPFELGCAYRAKGYDFIAITDHHKYYPSLEGKEIFDTLTGDFTVFRGEEVHNFGMGYFHIINFDGDFSVNEIVEEREDYVKEEISKIFETANIPNNVADKYDCAFRMFVAKEIQKGGGLAIMAHPYWDAFGEYNMQESSVRYLWKNGVFDALELLAGCDRRDNGNNLQVALWEELREQGIKIPVVGASDTHSTTNKNSLFNLQYSLVFAKDRKEIKSAIKAEFSVAVLARKNGTFFVFGRFALVKYARFLLEEYFPQYIKLTKIHARALKEKDESKIKRIEKKISVYKKKFFAW